MENSRKKDGLIIAMVLFLAIWLFIIICKILVSVLSGDFLLEPKTYEYKSVQEQIRSESMIQ